MFSMWGKKPGRSGSSTAAQTKWVWVNPTTNITANTIDIIKTEDKLFGSNNCGLASGGASPIGRDMRRFGIIEIAFLIFIFEHC